MVVKCELCGSFVSHKSRNYKHHRKLFVLFGIGYDNWDQSCNEVHTTKDQFRKMILIKSGYHTSYCDIDGNVVIEAQSISYSKMGAEVFEQCYRDCLHVIAKRLLQCGLDDLHDMVMEQF